MDVGVGQVGGGLGEMPAGEDTLQNGIAVGDPYQELLKGLVVGCVLPLPEVIPLSPVLGHRVALGLDICLNLLVGGWVKWEEARPALGGDEGIRH